jgi:hypothetical protein
VADLKRGEREAALDKARGQLAAENPWLASLAPAPRGETVAA